MDIRPDDLTHPAVHALLEAHVRDMHRWSPPGSVHVLDLAGLRRPEVAFWAVWDGAELLGCGALKQLAPDHGEIKSMRTAPAHRGRGVGTAVLEHLLAEAQRRGYARLSLETGAQPEFEPARALYRRYGFGECGPFADYRPDPHSTFMTRTLP
jgi:putative acetyltransferase